MKNLKSLALLVLVVAVLMMSFTSCEQLAGIPGFDKILEMLPGADTHEHVFGEATCTTPATCECGVTEGEALGHSFENGACSVCGETDPNYVPPHEHNFVDGVCECGETDPNYVPPHEHSFVDGKCECGETDPNYVPPHEHNFVEGKCECGETDPNYVPPHEHNFVEGKCECGETDPNYVPPHEHSFVEGKCECGEYDHEHEFEENVFFHPELEAATCTAPGVAVFECTICDYYYTEATPIDPEAHGFWGDREVLVEANCQTQTNGLEKVYCANGCGNFEEVEIFYSDLHNWDVQTEIYATCTSDGEYYAVCTLCGEIESYDIPAEGHWSWFVLCGETGECMGCGEAFTKEHNTVWSPATCTEAAYCMNCYSYVGEPLGHHFVNGLCHCGEEYVAPAPTVGNWTLVTELKTGDLVLIGAPAYGKLLSMVKVSTYYNKGVDYSASDFSNVTDDEIFVVTVNEDGTYTFVSLSGKLLAQEGTYASLNDAGTQKSWVIEAKNGADGIFYLKNTGTGKYLEWYASKDNWSTYAGTLSDLFELSFYVMPVSDEDHVHNYISEEHAPTCTEAGYTSFTCSCGDTYTENEVEALGHSYVESVVAPTCTEAGYTSFTCSCGDSYTENELAALGHTFEEGKCTVCGAEDPDFHVHSYEPTVTAPTCTVAGYTTFTCACGDTYTGDETEPVGHVDDNLDITCDFEGCSKRILPAADSKISLFTANHMVIISLSSNYYVEGTVTSVEDARNGKFIITDEAGDTILIYLPVDENGVTHANWVSKVLVGDVVRVYGKPVNTSGLNTTQTAAIKSGTLTFISKHPHTFGEPTCLLPGYCECGQDGPVALGHADEDGNDLCDRCEFNLKLDIETVTTKYNDVKDTDKVDTTNGVATFDGVNFTATFTKGSASFNTNGTDHMRLNKGNVLTVTSNNGKNIVGITLVASTSSYVDELELYCQALGYEYTVEGNEITFMVDACTVLELANSSNKAQRIAAVKVIYEK